MNTEIRSKYELISAYLYIDLTDDMDWIVMVQKKELEDRASSMLCLTERTKQRILDLRVIGDTHENVVVRILDFYEQVVAKGESCKTDPAANKLGVSNANEKEPIHGN